MSSSRRFSAVALAAAVTAAGCGSTPLANLKENAQVFLVSPDGKQLRRVTNGDSSDYSISWSPDGRRIAFASAHKGFDAIELMRLDGTGRRIVTESNLDADAALSWSPDGRRLAFMTIREPTPGSVAFERRVETISVRGHVRPEVVSTFAVNRVLPFGPVWSRRGELAYATAVGRYAAPKIVIADANGRHERRAAYGRGAEFDPLWSPRGDVLLFTREREPENVYALFAARGSKSWRVIPWFVDVIAEWAPDGRRIAVAGVPPDDERYRLVIVALHRGVQMRFPEEVATVRPSWSPDGTRVAFATYDGLTVADLRTRKVRTIATTPSDVEVAEVAWAPTGRWIAFTASYVRPSD